MPMCARPAGFVAVILMLACGAAAQSADLFVAADEGAKVRPIARFDGRTWTPTCEVPSSRSGRGRADAPIIVASTGVRIDAVRHVKGGTSEWAGIDPVVRRLFQQREREQSVSAAALDGVPLAIDAVLANGLGATPQIYFFKASKSVPDSRGPVDLDDDGEVDPPGTLRVDVSGWLRGGSGSVTSLGTNATLSWEQDDAQAEGSRRSDLHPVAVVRVGDTHVWILRGQAASVTWFTLYDVSASGVRTLARSDSRC